MATIAFAKLDSSRPTKGSVDFLATVNIKFSSHEIGHLWEIEMQLWEDDRIYDDKLGNPVKRSFSSTSSEMTVQIGHRLSVRTVNTEIGDEEVYGEMTVRPINQPLQLMAATAKTGIEVVNV